MKLKDRVALITGGGSGIGRAIAKCFAGEGAHVIVAGRRVDMLNQTIAELASNANRSLALQADVSEAASVKKLFKTAGEEFGRLDILVNNAGIGVDGLDRFNRTAEARGKEIASGEPIHTQWNITKDMTDAAWHDMIGVHLDGMFFCTREALGLMSENGGGAIVNISSTAALAGQEGAPHYSAAKAGMLGFTRSLAREVASQNIRVNALTPGFVTTPMSEGYSPAFQRGTKTRIPMGRWGSPEEVASAALFLASDDGSYFTGQSLSPNGGIYMV